MCIEAQLVIVTFDDYEWLFVNGEFVGGGHTIAQHIMLRTIHQYELDGSYATYEVSTKYIDENSGDLPDKFEDIPQSELSLLSYAEKRKTL